jgi:hypothetical protein
LSAVDTAEELRARAEHCERRSSELRDEARALMAQAVVYRRQATEREIEERRRVEEPLANLNGSREVGEMVLEVLAGLDEPQPLSVLATILGEEPDALRRVMAKLIDARLVVRTGLKRGTRYRLPEAGEDPEDAELASQRYEGAVRDAARRLGTFTVDDLAGEFPDVSRMTLYRWLKVWVERGALERERVGKAYVFAVLRPDDLSAPTTAPRSAPKPWEAPERVARGAPVAKPFSIRVGRRESRDLLALAVEAGGELVKEQAHGYLIEYEGKRWSIPKTASDHRSLANARAKLRAMGLDL